MKNILDWDAFSLYDTFAQTHPILENASPEDDNRKRARVKVNYAMQKLTGKYRFFAELAYKLRIIYTRNEGIPVAATDGTNLFINPDEFAKFTEDQILFVLCHEVLHCALLHFARMNGRDHLKWNHATDYEINLLLTIDGILTVDQVKNEIYGLINTDYAGMNAEQIYDVLTDPNKPDEKQNDNPQGDPPPPKGEKRQLKVGDVIRNDRTGGYGVVTSIDAASGSIDYDPISKEDAKERLTK